VTLAGHGLDVLVGGETAPRAEQDLTERPEESGEAVDEAETGHYGEDDEPEPQEDVDLLVEDVER